jgi:hypothetical protein
VERLITDDTGFAKLFCTFDGPGCFQPLTKYLLILLEPGWGQKVLAVECELKAKEIKDGFDDVPSFFGCKSSKYGDI